jgi:hypothetical protein
MFRYEEADESLVEVFLNVVESFFPMYQNLKFKLMFDTKKRVKGGKVVLSSVELASEKVKFFSKDNIAVEGYDYIVTVDKKAWEVSANTKDRERLIRHEMRHVFIDEKGKPKIVGHEIEDFYAEIEANKDNPEWARRLTILVEDIYEQERELTKEAKTQGV